MNKLSKIKGKIADKKINALGVLVFLIFLSIAPVQAKTIIIDSCPSGASVYSGGITAQYKLGVTPLSITAPTKLTALMFNKQYYGWQQGYMAPTSPDYYAQPLYYWGGEPDNTMPANTMTPCDRYTNPYSTPAPTPTPYKAPAPTSTPYKAPAPTPIPTLAPKSGSAIIDSTPSGADVYLRTLSGEIKIGVTPFVYTLPSQLKVIVFKKAGYLDRITYINSLAKSPFVVSLSK